MHDEGELRRKSQSHAAQPLHRSGIQKSTQVQRANKQRPTYQTRGLKDCGSETQVRMPAVITFPLSPAPPVPYRCPPQHDPTLSSPLTSAMAILASLTSSPPWSPSIFLPRNLVAAAEPQRGRVRQQTGIASQPCDQVPSIPRRLPCRHSPNHNDHTRLRPLISPTPATSIPSVVSCIRLNSTLPAPDSATRASLPDCPSWMPEI